MAQFNLRRFSSPEVLKGIAPERLLAFLTPFREYLKKRGFVVPTDLKHFDYESLVRIFMSPDGDSADLVDALWRIDDLATPEAMDRLLDGTHADSDDCPLDGASTPADVAVAFWLKERDLFDRVHAQQYIGRFRSSEFFQSPAKEPPKYKSPSKTVLEALESALDDRFEKRKRGRGSRIFVFDRDRAAWFLIRHGMPLRREESIKNNGGSSTVCFRPIKYDVVVYHFATGELQVHAESPKEKDAYRQDFGKFLFGDAETFPGLNKYTLEPLRKGPSCLACNDVEGIDWIRLLEVHFFYGGVPWEIIIRKSEDYYALLDSKKNKEFPKKGRIIQAKFSVKFADSKTARSVVIKPGNIAQVRREDDAERVDAWLRARGFVLEPEHDDASPQVDKVLDVGRRPADKSSGDGRVAVPARRRAR